MFLNSWLYVSAREIWVEWNRKCWREEEPPERHATNRISLREVMLVDFLSASDKVLSQVISRVAITPYADRLRALQEAERIHEMMSHAAYAMQKEVLGEILSVVDRSGSGRNVPSKRHATRSAMSKQSLNDGRPNSKGNDRRFCDRDLSATAGIRTTYGSLLQANNVPSEDGLMVRRIRDAGAIVIGKTNTPEFGLGSHTYNPIFGVTRNAYDTSLSAGGSSGGAAVAVALNMVPLADGGDMMGSLRNPAGWNNVFGFRPSFRGVPNAPSSDLFLHQLSTNGPMARGARYLARS
ncbi:hypothetical protein HFN47_35790 [Rhizobium leguminosarum]|nr:hypothetical protein [Rhizobium leguminosarum]MBY5863122.1 hypothetical protein [Rhizobium leguminosarum]